MSEPVSYSLLKDGNFNKKVVMGAGADWVIAGNRSGLGSPRSFPLHPGL